MREARATASLSHPNVCQIYKVSEDRGERNPDLSRAHNLYARLKIDLGNAEDAMLDLLQRSIEGGFHCVSALRSDPWLDALRPDGRFTDIIQIAEMRGQKSRAVFIEAGGDELFSMLG